jgi:hypothetical protein
MLWLTHTKQMPRCLLLVPSQVESDMYERVYQKCQNERMAQHRTYTWGNRCADMPEWLLQLKNSITKILGSLQCLQLCS